MEVQKNLNIVQKTLVKGRFLRSHKVVFQAYRHQGFVFLFFLLLWPIHFEWKLWIVFGRRRRFIYLFIFLLGFKEKHNMHFWQQTNVYTTGELLFVTFTTLSFCKKTVMETQTLSNTQHWKRLPPGQHQSQRGVWPGSSSWKTTQWGIALGLITGTSTEALLVQTTHSFNCSWGQTCWATFIWHHQASAV